MKRIYMGSIHKTWDNGSVIVQELNPDFKVPGMDEVNRLTQHLLSRGIFTAHVIAQNDQERTMEKLEGQFHEFLTEVQCIKAARFMARLHEVLAGYPALTSFRPAREFSPEGSRSPLSGKFDTIWADMNTSNILWRDGEPVGIVDYDTVSYGDRWYDIATACVRWQETFDPELAGEILAAYRQNTLRLDSRDLWHECRKFVLILTRGFSNAYFGRGIIKREQDYCAWRLQKLHETYETLCRKGGL